MKTSLSRDQAPPLLIGSIPGVTYKLQLGPAHVTLTIFLVKRTLVGLWRLNRGKIKKREGTERKWAKEWRPSEICFISSVTVLKVWSILGQPCSTLISFPGFYKNDDLTSHSYKALLEHHGPGCGTSASRRHSRTFYEGWILSWRARLPLLKSNSTLSCL